ncbi:MAG: hypothetical protein ACRBCK_02065 [Alphaproteobacteria bacterium]
MFHMLYSWIDIIWLPILFWGVHKKHRWWALSFGIASMTLIRLQTEIMVYIGYENGIMGLMTSNVHTRGVAVSSVFYILFLLLAHFSRQTMGVVFMAACLSFFFMIFVTGSLIMLL